LGEGAVYDHVFLPIDEIDTRMGNLANRIRKIAGLKERLTAASPAKGNTGGEGFLKV
jgi:hypothetical protein